VAAGGPAVFSKWRRFDRTAAEIHRDNLAVALFFQPVVNAGADAAQ
jgi:hypothetical protein